MGPQRSVGEGGGTPPPRQGPGSPAQGPPGKASALGLAYSATVISNHLLSAYPMLGFDLNPCSVNPPVGGQSYYCLHFTDQATEAKKR